jgi:hypothetical protein
MDFVADLGAGFAGVDLADIVLKIVFLTVPGIALAKGLERFREPAGPAVGGGKAAWVKARLNRLGTKLASFITIVAMLAAGLGLVPLARAVYTLISGAHEVAPALIGVGVIVVAVLLVKGFVMDREGREVMDGKVDRRPLLLLMPVPLLAMLVWVAPVVWAQITHEAGQTVQMIMDEAEQGGPGDKPETKETEEEKDGSRGGTGADE